MDFSLDKIADKKLNRKSINLIYDIFLGVLAFMIPFIILLVIFSQGGFAPFSSKGLTIISLDMQSEYIAYMRYYKQILLGNNSLIYTQTKTFGGDFMSIYCFYLASPFNFLILLFSDQNIPTFFILTNMFKMCFASLNFYLMERFTFKKKKIGYLIFSIAYGLISYSFIYMSNFMWLDGVMILPIVILGIQFLKEGKHLYIYPLAICYSLMTSWYTGFIICVFVFIFLIYTYLTMKGSLKDNLPFALRAVIFSLVGGFLASAFWVTAFLHLSGTKAYQEFPKFYFFSISTFFTAFLENNYTSVSVIQQYRGYISMFVGAISLVFALKYFMNKGYTIRERFGALLLIVFYFFVVENSILNALFHGGKEPTWFPGRYSFTIGFLVCYFASLEFEKSEDSSRFSFIIPSIMVCIVLPIVVFVKNSNELEELQHYEFSFVSLLLYLLTLLLTSIYPFIRDFEIIKKNKVSYQFALSLILIPLACYSSYRGGKKVVDSNISENQYQTMETYLSDDSYQKAFDNIKNYDPDNDYRMEAVFNRDGNYNQVNNNPMFYSYNGLNHFSSCVKNDVTNFMKKLGFHKNYYFEKYDGGSTSSINSFLNIKYLIDNGSYSKNKPVFQTNTDSRNNWKKIEFETAENEKKMYYYENTKAIPYAMIMEDMDRTYVGDGYNVLINGEVVSTHWYDAFEFQNELFKCITSSVTEEVIENDEVVTKKKDIFKPIDYTLQDTAATSNCYKSDEDTYIINVKKGTKLIFNFKIPDEAIGNNLYFTEKRLDNYFYYRMDSKYYENSSYWHYGIRSFDDNNSHEHTLSLEAKYDMSNYKLRLSIDYEDLDVMNEYLDAIISNSGYDLKEKDSLFSYSYIGKININESNKDKTLLFTFPNEKRNVSIRIDGKKMKVDTRINIFAACDYSSLKEGEHTIEFRYTDTGFILGCLISGISLVVLILLCIYYLRIENKIFKREAKELDKPEL